MKKYAFVVLCALLCNDLKNKAANLGGNTLLILNMEKGLNSTWGVGEYLVESEIYKCNY